VANTSVEVIMSVQRRRRWTAVEKEQLVCGVAAFKGVRRDLMD
jgi:hypothetical protein